MFSDEFIKKAKELVEANSQIIGIYFNLPAKDRELFKERFERITSNARQLINKINSDDKLRRVADK